MPALGGHEPPSPTPGGARRIIRPGCLYKPPCTAHSIATSRNKASVCYSYSQHQQLSLALSSPIDTMASVSRLLAVALVVMAAALLGLGGTCHAARLLADLPLPEVPGVPMPTLPDVPGIPTLPEVPKLPVPELPSVPKLPMPELPVVPGVPLPQVPAVP